MNVFAWFYGKGSVFFLSFFLKIPTICNTICSTHKGLLKCPFVSPGHGIGNVTNVIIMASFEAVDAGKKWKFEQFWELGAEASVQFVVMP